MILLVKCNIVYWNCLGNFLVQNTLFTFIFDLKRKQDPRNINWVTHKSIVALQFNFKY